MGYDESTQASFGFWSLVLSEGASLHSTNMVVTTLHLTAVVHAWQKGLSACQHSGPTMGASRQLDLRAECWSGLLWEGSGHRELRRGTHMSGGGTSSDDHDVGAKTQSRMRSRCLRIVPLSVVT